MQQQPQQPPLSPTQQTPPLSTAPVASSPAAAAAATNNARSNRLLYRRGLPDLPELIEAEEEDVTTDSTSISPFSTRHSTNTSMSSRDFISHSATGSISEALKTPIQTSTRLHDIYSQTPPGSVPQLQTPFEYVPASSFRLNPELQKEASPPPSPTPRDEALANAGMGYGLGVHLTTSQNFHSGASGMLHESYHESGMEAEGCGENECLLETCPECSGRHSSHPHSFAPYHRSSSSGEVNSSEVGDYMSPPSSPGTDCIILPPNGI